MEPLVTDPGQLKDQVKDILMSWVILEVLERGAIFALGI